MAEVAGFRRLIDFSGSSSDEGLYVYNGRIVPYPYGGSNITAAIGASYVQVAVTSRVTSPSVRQTVAYLNGVTAYTGITPQNFGLESGTIRFFKDNVSGPYPGEESAGALACVLAYDGALSAAEVQQGAVDPTQCPVLRPAPDPDPREPDPRQPDPRQPDPREPDPRQPEPRPDPTPAPPPQPGYRPGAYAGRTSQGLPISLVVTRTGIQRVAFGWRARCADGRVHSNGSGLGPTPVLGGSFSVEGTFAGTGARSRVAGQLAGDSASGRLSRWAGSAFGTTCVVRGVRWRAHLVVLAGG